MPAPGFTKQVLVEDNEVYNSQYALHIGNEFDGYAGPVAMEITVRGNYFHDNLDGGVVVADEDGTPCEDGAFCTVDDECSAGVCESGEPNDCGIAAEACMAVVCDENSQSCSPGTLKRENP